MKKLVSEWKNVALVVAVILLIAFLLRVINLTILPVFADEAIYIRWAQVMRAEPGLRFLPLSDGKQPLFMWVVIPFLKLFSDPLFAGRFVSVLTGMSTLVGVFTLSYLLFKSKTAAMVSSLLYSISPYAVFFDRMALVDSMLAMFGVWAAVFSVLTVRFIRLDTALLTGFALGGAALTKSPALFFFLLAPTSLIFSKIRTNKQWAKLNIAKTLSLLVVASGMGFVIYNILRLGENFHLVNSRNLDYVFPMSHIVESPLNPFIANFTTALSWIALMGPELLIVFVVLGLLFNFTKHKEQIIFLVIWALVPIIAQSLIAKVFTARYIFFTLPYWYILAGSYFLSQFYIKWKKASYILLGLFIVHALWLSLTLVNNPERARLPGGERSGYLVEWTAGTGIKEVAEYISAEHLREPDVPILVGTEGYFGTLPDGLLIYLEKIPNVNVIGVGLDINQIPESLKESAEAGNKTYLVANSSRLNFSGDFEQHGLEVIESYQKGVRPNGTFDYLHFFKVE